MPGHQVLLHLTSGQIKAEVCKEPAWRPDPDKWEDSIQHQWRATSGRENQICILFSDVNRWLILNERFVMKPC
ncbi:hypothetical protein Y1Q_0010929 [Alligator mississippiensis]|uniref:Uncharacterized protein n=1 Tax=Alligator mississippiensis TaxID=8496 RepID=A0A151MEC7_ALLMI|nr:hypothetical protein Y1Q_0010929 [Alligator mississippiensis]